METIELWHDRQRSWFKKYPKLVATNGKVLIQSLYSLVSTGTEKVVTSQDLNASLAEEMLVPHQKGVLGQTFTYGYSLVGKVIEGKHEGEIVHVMHPHQNMALVKVDDVRVIPQSMDPRMATLISNMETAVNAVWDAQIELGDRVLIQGYGIIGALLASLLKSFPGSDLQIHDIDTHKLDLMDQHGFHPYHPSQEEFDVVFNTTSSETALNEAFERTRLEGTVVELSWYGAKGVFLNLGDHFHHGRKRLISSQVSHIPYGKTPTWNYENRKDLVIRLLQEINPLHLLEHEIQFSNAPKFYNDLRVDKIKEISTLINYS